MNVATDVLLTVNRRTGKVHMAVREEGVRDPVTRCGHVAWRRRFREREGRTWECDCGVCWRALMGS